MSVIIISGAPGSGKTSKTIPDYIVPALQAGRTIITNIRGLRLELILQVYDIHSDSEFYNLEDEPVGIWLHSYLWVPPGSLVVVDEAQIQFPLNLRDIVNDGVKIPAGFKILDVHEANYMDGWDKHRHYNLDYVFTCPNISAVNKRLRGVAEVGLYLKNQATVLGWFGKGKYLEIQHNALLSPLTRANQDCRTTVKIDKRAFQCYQSTTTGKAKDTMATFAAFMSLKFILVFAVVFLAFGYVIFGGTLLDSLKVASGDVSPITDKSKSSKSSVQPSQPSQPSYSSQPSQPSQPSQVALPPLPKSLVFCGYAKSGARYYFKLYDYTVSYQGSSGVSHYSDADVFAMGFTIMYISPTMLILSFKPSPSAEAVKYHFTCSLPLPSQSVLASNSIIPPTVTNAVTSVSNQFK